GLRGGGHTAVTLHLGSRSNRTFTVEAAGSELDYYLLAGTPKEILAAYTDLTGKPPVPPEWAFGLWASTCFVKFTEASVLADARRLRQGRHSLRRLPSRFLLAARVHVVRLPVGCGASS